MKAEKGNAVERNKPVYIKRLQLAGHSGPWLTSCGVLAQLKISAQFKNNAKRISHISLFELPAHTHLAISNLPALRLKKLQRFVIHCS